MELHFYGYEIKLLPLRRPDALDTDVLDVKNIDGWWVEVPDLHGCVADGKTPMGALRAGQAAIKEWLDTAREYNRPIPQPQYFTGPSVKPPLRYRTLTQK